MKKICLLASLIGFVFLSAFSQNPKFPELDIPFKKFVLNNGLILIVHEDHKAPIVAVNTWYHVGSKNEKAGKSGFAHLFEHLMFNGSENYNMDYFKALENIGATDLNGTTNEDRTNYFQNVPVSALDQVLWLESDRMGHLLGVIDKPRLDEQRGVVQNEKRQGENQPYGMAYELTTKSTYPAGHPYSWSVIGSMEDLNAASIDDVKEWFKTYYGPNNAVLVIAGDITAEKALEKVKKYYGDIPPGPPIAKHQEWIAKMTGKHSQSAQDRVPQARLQKTWNVAVWGSQEASFLSLLSSVLTSGKSSRLYKRLVYDDKIASSVSSFTDERQISGQFYITADAKPDITIKQLDVAIDEELNRLMKDGISADELNRVKTQYFASFIKGMERIGGFGGKSDILAQNEVYGGSPDYYKKAQQWIRDATPQDIQAIAKKWLSDGEYALEILPFPTLKTDLAIADRKQLPALEKEPPITFPTIQEFVLSNGLKVMLAQRSSVPVVNMRLIMDAGYAADQHTKGGLTTLAMNMLKEGTKKRNSLQISDELADLGATLGTSADLDNSVMNLNALKVNFDKSLDLFADVLLNSVFPESDFDRVRKNQLLNIKQEQVQPIAMGLRILPKILYGEGHAYSNPFTGTGTEESVTAITRNDLIKFHQTWLAPNHATMLVVGDISMSELQSKLEVQLAGWKKKDIPIKNIPIAKESTTKNVYIIDKPDAQQSILFSAQLAPSGQSPDWSTMEMMNRIIGGEFTSRINMNLREDKHWSYGSGSVLIPAKGQGIYLGYGIVQTDKSSESAAELKKELEQFVGSNPATKEEFEKVQRNAILQLPGGWETNSSVLSALEEQVTFNRGNNYWPNYAEKVRKMDVKQIQDAAKKVIRPNNMTWIIVGDRAKIEKKIRELNLGEIHLINSEGKETKGF